MGFQTVVNFYQGFGIPGELYDAGPHRAEPFTLNSASAAYNIIGATAFSVVSQGIAAAGNSGGTAVFAGILVNPKAYASFGTSSGPLFPTLTLANQTEAELLTMGSIIVTLPAACAIGDLVIYDQTTGALSTVTPGTSLPSGKNWAYAVVDRFTPGASGVNLAVIRVTAYPGALTSG